MQRSRKKLSVKQAVAWLARYSTEGKKCAMSLGQLENSLPNARFRINELATSRPSLPPTSFKIRIMPHTLWVVPGTLVFFSVALTVIYRLEKRAVWPYGELEAAPYFGDPTGYGARWVADAVRAGYTFLGWARDTKGPTYRVSYAMLVSPERDIFAVIGVGNILNIQLEATWLHTPSVDGRSFYSTDKQAAVQIDLSGHWTNQLAPEGSFGQLLQKHREWIRSKGVSPRLFTQGREYAEFQALRAEHFRSMERAGLIRFTDGSSTHFFYTLPGAAKTATWSYFLGMARQLSHGKFPRSA